MSERRAFLDRAIGETRAVVTLNGRAEYLIVRRDDEDHRLALGARHVAQVAGVEPAIGLAFLDLGQGTHAVLPFRPDTRPVRGSAIEVEIRAEPRAGKLATARLAGTAEGPPRLLAPAPDPAEILARLVRSVDRIEGREARMIADEAEAEALETLT
jgi:hypothetical protein